MKKMISLLLALLFSAMTFSACDGSNELKNIDPYPVTVGQATIERSPRTVGSLSPDLTNLLIELGYQDRIVGYSDEDTLPETPTAPTESSGGEAIVFGQIGTALQPNLEKIGEYKPEIIFTTLPMSKASLDQLTEVGIKVAVLPAVKTVEELKSRCVDLIRAMEGERKARTLGEELVTRIGKEINLVTMKLTEQKVSVLYISSLDPLVATPDTYEADLLSYVAENAAKDGTNYTLSAEKIAALNPDVVLYSAQLEAEHIKQSSVFGGLQAVKDGKMIAVNEETLVKQTIVVADTIKAIAEKLYPSIDFTAEEEVSSEK